MHIAIVNKKTNKVENIAVEPRGKTGWEVPEGYEIIKTESGAIGDTYQNGEFIKPAPPPEPPPTPPMPGQEEINVAILKALNKMQMDGIYDMPAETDAVIQKWLETTRRPVGQN